MRCYDRRQLSFGHFNAGYLLGRAAGERVDSAIPSRIGFALLPAFKPGLPAASWEPFIAKLTSAKYQARVKDRP